MRSVVASAALLIASACAPRLYTEGDAVRGSDWVAPENRWPSTVPPASIVAEGFFVGQVVPDVRVPDQHGDEVSLWQFHGRVVLFDISTMWCAPCQELALGAEETAHEFADEAFTYLTVLQENVESHPPTGDDLNRWADLFGITSPVLADTEKLTAPAVQQGQYPAVLLIGPDLRVIRRVNPPDDPTIRAAIRAVL